MTQPDVCALNNDSIQALVFVMCPGAVMCCSRYDRISNVSLAWTVVNLTPGPMTSAADCGSAALKDEKRALLAAYSSGARCEVLIIIPILSGLFVWLYSLLPGAGMLYLVSLLCNLADCSSVSI